MNSLAVLKGAASSRATSSLARTSDQLFPSFFQHNDLAFQPLQLPVNGCKLRFCLPIPQVLGAMPFLDECFHLSPEKAKPGIAVHGLLLAMKLARANCSDDILPRQPELLLRRFVAEGRPFTLPLRIQIVHSLSSFRLILLDEGRGLPAILLTYLGMSATLGRPAR